MPRPLCAGSSTTKNATILLICLIVNPGWLALAFPFPPTLRCNTNGVLFYIAPQEHSIYQEVVALDAKDGEIALWRTDSPGLTGPNVIYTTSSTLYVGGSGNGKVAAYDLRTGEKLWSKSYPFQRTVTNLQVVDDLVYVKAVSDFRALLQADTGQDIKAWHSVPGFNMAYFQNMTLTIDTEFNNGPGQVSAKDRQTGRTLWETEAFSNAIVTETAVYLILGPDELKLVGIEPRSGEIINSVTFEPHTSPDYLNLYDVPHRLALDKELSILYVFLRDSRQVFAFKILGYPGRETRTGYDELNRVERTIVNYEDRVYDPDFSDIVIE